VGRNQREILKNGSLTFATPARASKEFTAFSPSRGNIFTGSILATTASLSINDGIVSTFENRQQQTFPGQLIPPRNFLFSMIQIQTMDIAATQIADKNTDNI
jgi:hypothetical protein